MNLLEFAALMPELIQRVEAESTHALDRAAAVVQREAKRELGHYQDQAGPFVGWAELADATKADRIAQGYPENEPELRSGAMRESIERSVTSPHEAHVGSNSDIAVYQELGTSRMPPRSFLGIAAVHKEDAVHAILGRGVVSALVGKDVYGGRLDTDA